MSKRQTTYYAKPSDIDRQWFIIDATDQVLGRLASKVAQIVRGKEKPNFTPGMDTGDFVVVINTDKIRVTGNKAEDKVYYRHSGYPGGLKETQFKDAMAKNSRDVVAAAVKGMLPSNRLGRQLFKKVKLYAGDTHDNAAQKPQKIEL